MRGAVAIEGYIFTVRRARKEFTCCICQGKIMPGDFYYSVTIGGGGLGSLKFPERIHLGELENFIDRRGDHGREGNRDPGTLSPEWARGIQANNVALGTVFRGTND